jgi:hypothetical protein
MNFALDMQRIPKDLIINTNYKVTMEYADYKKAANEMIVQISEIRRLL